MKNTERPVGQSGRPFDQQPRNEYGPLVKWPKTPASHAGNMGSNPVRVTTSSRTIIVRDDFFVDEPPGTTGGSEKLWRSI